MLAQAKRIAEEASRHAAELQAEPAAAAAATLAADAAAAAEAAEPPKPTREKPRPRPPNTPPPRRGSAAAELQQLNLAARYEDPTFVQHLFMPHAFVEAAT